MLFINVISSEGFYELDLSAAAVFNHNVPRIIIRKIELSNVLLRNRERVLTRRHMNLRDTLSIGRAGKLARRSLSVHFHTRQGRRPRCPFESNRDLDHSAVTFLKSFDLAKCRLRLFKRPRVSATI